MEGEVMARSLLGRRARLQSPLPVLRERVRVRVF
jgi:hypothetical protein